MVDESLPESRGCSQANNSVRCILIEEPGVASDVIDRVNLLVHTFFAEADLREVLVARDSEAIER